MRWHAVRLIASVTDECLRRLLGEETAILGDGIEDLACFDWRRQRIGGEADKWVEEPQNKSVLARLNVLDDEVMRGGCEGGLKEIGCDMRSERL